MRRCPRMAAPRKAEHAHPRALGGLDPGRAVLDHDTPRGIGMHSACGEEEEVGRGLAVRDHRGAEDAVAEKRRRPVSSSDRRMRSIWLDEATQSRHAQAGQGLRDAGDGAQFLAEQRIEPVTHPVQGVGLQDHAEIALRPSR